MNAANKTTYTLSFGKSVRFEGGHKTCGHNHRTLSGLARCVKANMEKMGRTDFMRSNGNGGWERVTDEEEGEIMLLAEFPAD